VAHKGHLRNSYNTVVRKPQEKREFGRPKCRQEHTIKTGLRQKGCGLPQYAFVAWCSVKAQGKLYLYLLPFTGFNELRTAYNHRL
jgi:hypothetical protein